MDDKFNDFFNKNNFDIHEPYSGHEERFLRKLQQPKKKSISYKWMGAVASIVLLLGFYLGSFHQQKQYDLRDVSPKMAEAQDFFVSTINQELKEIEKYRSLETETLIEEALEEIEELEEKYQSFKSELNQPGNQRIKIQAMINNYQQRLDVLQRLLDQLNRLQKPIEFNSIDDEII